MEDPLATRVSIAHQEIIGVMNRRAMSADRRQWDHYADCHSDPYAYKSPYTDGWITLSREESVARVTRLFAEYDATQHISANHVVNVDGDQGSCVSSLNATHYIAKAAGGPRQTVIGCYDARLIRTDAWRIARIELVVWWEEGNQAVLEQAMENAGRR